jgi:hypothetical protein
MELTELQAAALKAQPVEIVHDAGGRTLFYEIDARFDPEVWKYALAGVSIARAAGANLVIVAED